MADKITTDRSDGYVSIDISEDRMEARATFHPSSGSGRPLEYVQAESALAANNITFGIQADAVMDAIAKCNSEMKPVKDVLIALGKKPVKASPAHINLKPEFFNRTRTVVKADGSVDHKESSPFIMVKKGEVVGRNFPYRAGEYGTDITGESIPYKNKDMQIFKTGENLETRGEFVISLVHGRFIIDGDNILVSEVLEIATDIDYHTGNISFAGDLIVDGVIQDGFRVAAGGNIRCKQLIKNAEVLGRGDLDLDLGVKGRESALIRINGMIRAKFIEYGTVESRTGISVSTSIMTANINTLGSLTMGQKGTVVTSTITAEKGVEVFNLGRENCAPSLIECGISFVEKRKLDNLKIRHDVLLDKIHKVELKNDPPPGLLEQMLKAKEQQEKEIETAKKELCTFPEARVVVHGTLFAGTEIRICNYRLKIEKNVTRVFVKIDQEKLMLVINPLV